MFVTLCVIAGMIAGIIDAIIVRKSKKFSTTFFTMIKVALLANIIGLAFSDVVLRYHTGTSVLPIESQPYAFQFYHFAVVLVCGLLWILFSGIYDGIFIFKHE